MSGKAWLVDQSRIATKIRSASVAYDQEKVHWKSNPSKSCPNCEFVIDNADVAHAWPGLPRGVKFDPSDQEIIWHLLSKSGDENCKPHPFIDEFIPTVDEEDGICYTHPQNLPGVKQDGSVTHFFHRAIKAYNTGTRKRRKIHGFESGDVRWHKTGRTKPVILDGVQKGCKKIMVLYVSSVRGGKAEKTNWVMHQYHLGTGEDEKEGEYVLSKVFYQQQQQQQTKAVERIEEDIPESIWTAINKVDPLTPKSVDPEPRTERRFSNYEPLLDSAYPSGEHHNEVIMEDEIEDPSEHPNDEGQINVDNLSYQVADNNANADNDDAESVKWWEDVALLNSQQLVEGLSICDDLLESQSPNRDEAGIVQGQGNKPRLADYARLGSENLKKDLEECQNFPSDPANLGQNIPRDELANNRDEAGIFQGQGNKPRLADYARLGSENLKRDLEECQNLPSDPANLDQHIPRDELANIDLDTPPDFRLSQLEFESQDSYIAWGGSCHGGKVVHD